MKSSGISLPFQERYPLEKRQQMAVQAQKNKPGCVLIVIQKSVSCSLYPTLTSNLFLTNKEKPILSIQEELKRRLQKLIDRSLERESLFIHTHKRLLNKDQKVSQIYELCKNIQDGILYLQYSNVNPF